MIKDSDILGLKNGTKRLLGWNGCYGCEAYEISIYFNYSLKDIIELIEYEKTRTERLWTEDVVFEGEGKKRREKENE